MEPEEGLCATCKAIDLRPYLCQDSYPGTVRLGPFQEILKKDNCAFCRLIIQALDSGYEDHWVAGVYPSEVCYLGRNRSPSDEPVLEVWFDSTSETLPENMCGHITTHGEILAVNADSCCGREAESRPATWGRLVESFVDFSLLRSWLDECDKQHGRRCGATEREISFHRQYLIDVKRHCLVRWEKNCRYLALSYVWGKVRMLQTNRSNLGRLQENGALKVLGPEIPMVIKNAMEVVAGLGENYLWVDSLCIVQDDEVSLKQISQMDVIYRQAILTLFAIAGEHANCGLPGTISKPRPLHQASETIQGMTLTTKLADLSRIIETSRWGSRAWTFQEQILSRRGLYFTANQVYFQYRSGMRREDCLIGHSSFVATDNPLDREIWPSDEHYSPIFGIYASLVMKYTRKVLSYQSDILNAFNGIISSMQERFSWQFVSALPEASLDLALLWRPISSSHPRFPSRKLSAEVSVNRFPSWCWTSTVGEVYWNGWRTAGYAGNEITLIPAIEYFVVKKGDELRFVEVNRQAHHPEPSSASLSSFNFSGPELHPDLPVLCFWAETVSLDDLGLSYEKHHPKLDDHPFTPYLKTRLSNKVWIYDSANYHCGTITGLESWPSRSDSQTAKHEFVILSHCHQKVVTQGDIDRNLTRLPLEFPSSQEYYDEMFDTYHYTPKTNWAVNVMLIKWKREDYAVRIGIGQIHVDVLRSIDKKRKIVRLA